MGACALQHRTAQRSIRPCVKINLTVESREDAVLIAAKRESALHCMALGMEIDRLLAGKYDFHRTIHLHRRQSCDVLGGDVLLSAETASDQLVLHYDTLRIPSEHDRDLLSRVIDSLVCRQDLHPVLVRKRHRALRLEESMFCERRRILLCHHIF